jgi:hypothetical protein
MSSDDNTSPYENIIVPIKIGKSAKENWELIDQSDGDWTWVHLQSFPSCHVIIECKNPSQHIIKHAGYLCKMNTKYKNVPNIKISYCLVKNLNKGEKTGEVYFKSNRQVKEFKI